MNPINFVLDNFIKDRVRHIKTLLIMALFQAGCAATPDILFHELALAPSMRKNTDKSFDLPFDAYIIGIEKDNGNRVGQVEECRENQTEANCLRIDAPYFKLHPEIAANLRDKYQGQWRPTFVSHIAVFSSDLGKPCYLYNNYSSADRCAVSSKQLLAKGEYVAQGWAALETLRPDLLARVTVLKPTHIVIYMMGWNTPQWEALQNYRDLRMQLEAAAKEYPALAFRALYIGLTWPSTGSPTIKGSDYAVKAKDADEVGALWGNILIHRVVGPVKRETGVRVVVIGHSFGARASSRAAFSGPLVSDAPNKVVDLLVGLQGAYSFQRYIASGDHNSTEGSEGAPYRDFKTFVGKVVLTASRFDEANTAAGHRNFFVGSADVFARTKSSGLAEVFEHRDASLEGTTGLPECNASKVLFVDASAIVHRNQAGTGGGAHSDIYTKEIGRLIYEQMRLCTQ